MNRDLLLALAKYDAEMNDVLFGTVERLSEEELNQPSPIRKSIRTLLHHLLSTKPFFIAACQERSFDSNSDRFWNTAKEMNEYARRYSEEAQSYITSLDDAALTHVSEFKIRGQTYRLPIWQLLTQAFMHSAQHRGELSALLTNLGHPLPLQDILVQFFEESGQPLP